MKVRILGTAAGGGSPQWNCACPTCTSARAAGTGRTQDCLAVSADGAAWYLVNASPDLRTQLLAAPELAPVPGTRETPLRGVLFTSAELDHTLGLLGLREAARLDVYATAEVRTALHEALPAGPILAGYTCVEWHTVRPGAELVLDGGLRATPIPLSSKRPRYCTHLEGKDWTIAYRFSDAGGGVLVYAPGLAALTPDFADAVAGADLVLLDGTFATADELAPRTAGSMGHLPIAESLPFLRAHRGPRYLYTHLNNTNPLAHGDGAGHAALAGAGAAVAADGQLIEV